MKVAAAIFHSPAGESLGERLVEEGREASTRDLVATMQQAGVERIFLLTPNDHFAAQMKHFGAHTILSRSDQPFHFGEALKRVIAGEKFGGLLYFGSGSGGLLTVEQMRTLTRFAAREEAGALCNNFYSCDFCAIAHAQILLNLELPAIDNALGFSLSDQGISCYALPRELATQFDIDTPTDLFLLAAAKRGGAAMGEFFTSHPLFQPRLASLLEVLTTRNAHLVLIGRVNPLIWSRFEEEVACRTSVYSEGRGMRAYPDKRSLLLAPLIHEVGIEPFFDRLGRSADAAIIDTRPLLAREQVLPPAADRFASDLLRPDLIEDPLWSRFTRAAIAAEIPILLGGHSLVSGGLTLLGEMCWKDHDLSCRLHPETIDWKKE